VAYGEFRKGPEMMKEGWVKTGFLSLSKKGVEKNELNLGEQVNEKSIGSQPEIPDWGSHRNQGPGL